VNMALYVFRATHWFTAVFGSSWMQQQAVGHALHNKYIV
jgi:hypothetical protein